jgi:subtilisin-like proprotein convertase family protein
MEFFIDAAEADEKLKPEFVTNLPLLRSSLLRIVAAMKLRQIICCLLAMSSIVLAKEPDLTKPLKSEYEVETGGMKRQLVVSPQEIAVIQADGRRLIQALPEGDLAKQAKAMRTKMAGVGEVEIVLVETANDQKSKQQKREIRHFVTREVLVRLKSGVSSKVIAKATGLRITREPEYAPGMVIFDAVTSEAALAMMDVLRAMPEVESADVLLATQRAKKWIPNDPLFSEQWHHRNTTQLGGALWVDTGITSIWDTFRGAGVTIGIIDDGVQHTHPDLQGNYNGAIDYDYNSNDNNPTPENLVEDSHGTACAGVAAAIGGNGIGVSGAAPQATIAGFRLIAAPSTDQNEADAFNAHNQIIQIKSNSWGQPDGNGYGGPGILARAALEAAVTSGRDGKGVIQVFSAGNGLHLADNSNYDGYANSPFVIAVASVNDSGFQSYYSETGANVLISAPSNSGGKNQGIRTTDLVGTGGYNKASGAAGDYASDFGGTSSACPLVSGIIALMLEANPNLGWRDVKEILIRTARKPHRTDVDWQANGEGLSFNHKYGAGMIDATAAVALAQQWVNLSAMSTTQGVASSLPAAIADNNSIGVSRPINITTPNFRVEHVTVTVNATHAAVGDLEVTLTSPSGMVSRLSEAHPDGTDNLAWTFSSVRHWGEAAAGTWTVKVADRLADDTGTLTSVAVKLWGSTQTTRIAGTNATFTSETLTPANLAADPGETVSFSLSLKNNGAAATSAFTATLLPLGGVRSPSAAQSFGVINVGATASRSFTFKLEGGCGMSIPLVLKLHDGVNHLGFANLFIPLGTSSSSFFNGGAITIRDNHTASPSPSNLSVSALTGRVQNLTAQLNGFSHGYVDDVGVLLHGPSELKIRFFNGGVGAAVSSLNLTFDDEAALLFPSFGSLTTGSYRAWDVSGSSRSFVGDSNAEIAYSLGEFRGLNANGNWRLYVQDFAGGDSGSISSWRLYFTTVTCVDNVFLAATAISGVEGTGSIPVSVIRTGGREGQATVNYATTTGGTATAGSDYASTSGTLSFAPGELVKTFNIPVTNDSSMEANETIAITLSSASGNTTLGTPASGTATIMDDDTKTPVTLSPAAQTVAEAATLLTFTVSRATLGDAGTVAYSTSNGTATAGSDFSATNGILNFSSGDLTKNFTVAILNDNVFEVAENFTLTLSNATGGLVLGSPHVATVSVVDGDADNDVMPDDYELTHGLNPALNDASLNLDGDEYTNIAEYVIGTLPNDGRSFFHAVPSVSPAHVTLTFPSLAGRQYRVERSTSLTLGSWMLVQENIVGTGSEIHVTDNAAAAIPSAFYRVIVTRLSN